MALSTKKKNLIIADHKAGRFDTQTELLKHYKIDRKTLVKILEGISATNTDIVDLGVAYESAKKSLKNPVEIKAVENVVKQRTIADDIKDEALSATLINIQSVKKKLELEEVETMQEHKYAQETIDKALISAEVAPRHAPKVEVTNTNAQQNNTPTQISIVRDNG